LLKNAILGIFKLRSFNVVKTPAYNGNTTVWSLIKKCIKWEDMI